MVLEQFLEGVSRYYQFLYTAQTAVWQSFVLVMVLIGFILVQAGFLYLYFRLFKFMLNLYPQIKTLFYRIEKAIE